MENKATELSGKVAVSLEDTEQVNLFCSKYIPDFDRQRFEFVALRVYRLSDLIVTIYLADRSSLKTVRELRYPVKKFKVTNVQARDLLFLAHHFNFTVCAANYELDDMDITNR